MDFIEVLQNISSKIIKQKNLINTEEATKNALIDAERIGYRDTISYFGILCDNNNRKPICRLHFNGKQKYIGILDTNKSEEKVPIDNLNEIYKQADRLRATAGLYVKQHSIT